MALADENESIYHLSVTTVQIPSGPASDPLSWLPETSSDELYWFWEIPEEETSWIGIGEVVYTIVRWIMQYYLLQIDYEPHMASIVSQCISMVIYMITLNLSVKITKLYKDEH